MQSVTSMEMASSIFINPNIKTEKIFFGLLTKVIYTTTNSQVIGDSLEFSPTEGQKVKELFEVAPKERPKILEKNIRFKTCENGNFRLNFCYSKDFQFAAFHLQQFSGFEYHTVGEVHIIEGNDASSLIHIFIK